MKIRINFVSNSSSSNCIVVANPLTIKDIKDIIAGYNVVSHELCAYAYDNSLSDGQDFFKLSNDLLKTIAEYDLFDKFYYYDTFACWDADSEKKMKRNDFPEGEFVIFTLNIDYHVTDDSEKLLSRYLDKK